MLLFMDGQAHYSTAQLGMKYSHVDTTACTYSVVPEGRYGNCIKRLSTANGGSGFLDITPLMTRSGVWSLTTSGVCGFALKIDDLEKVDTSLELGAGNLIKIVEGANHHLRVVVNPSGTLALVRYMGSTYEGSNGPLIIAESVEALAENTWMFIEFKWVIDSTAGSFEIRLNGVTILTYTGDTRSHGLIGDLGVWNTVRILSIDSVPSPGPLLTLRMADLYVADLTGGAGDVKDFLGDGTIATIFPDGPGLAAGWTPNPAAPTIANWDQVNDKPAPDDDATYVVTTAPATRDVHTFENIPAGSTVFGAHYNMLLRKEEAGTAMIKPVVGQGGVQYDGPEQGVASDAYDHYLAQPYDLNPATGAAWTAAEINAGQWGIVKTA